MYSSRKIRSRYVRVFYRFQNDIGKSVGPVFSFGGYSSDTDIYGVVKPEISVFINF